MQSVHEPLQAPDEAVAKYASAIADFDRRVTAAMVSTMDTAIGEAVDGWERAGLWQDTVLVFTTGERHSVLSWKLHLAKTRVVCCKDNGGPQPTHNNYPLRGGKFTTVRTCASSAFRAQVCVRHRR